MAEPRDFTPSWLNAKPDYMLPQDWARLQEAYWLYTNTYYRHTVITRNFLAPLNVAYMVAMLNRAMSQKTNTRYTVPEFYTGELQQDMAEVAYGNSIYNQGNMEKWRVKASIDELTWKFIDKWITELSIGWSGQSRFNAWALENDRMQFFPYPEQEQHTLHNVAYETGDYMLSSPWSRGFNDFLTRYNQPECLRGNVDTSTPKYFFKQAGF